MYRVAIIGGGISGLAAAYFLERRARTQQLDISIRLFEAGPRLGGVIFTERAQGFLLEGGPDSFLTQKQAAIDLCRELGLADRFIPSNDDRRKTFVLHNGRLRQLPEGLVFVVPAMVLPLLSGRLLSLLGKLRLMASPWLSPPSSATADDVSVAEFIRSRFGREVLERLAEPLLAAVYGADVEKLSAQAVLPQLIALERQYGSLWRAFTQRRAQPQGGEKQTVFLTLRDGLGEMVRELHLRLTRTEITMNCPVESISRGGDGNLRVACGQGIIPADSVILALPAARASRILASLDADLASLLSEIRYHSSVLASFGFDASRIPRLQGFGFVVPRAEGRRMVACTWVHNKFDGRAEPGRALVRCFFGGARDAKIALEPDAAIQEIALRELADIAGIEAPPILCKLYRWVDAMPQYGLGHKQLLERIEARLAGLPGLYLAGNGYRGVGIPDCVQSASQAADKLLEAARSSEKGNPAPPLGRTLRM